MPTAVREAGKMFGKLVYAYKYGYKTWLREIDLSVSSAQSPSTAKHGRFGVDVVLGRAFETTVSKPSVSLLEHSCVAKPVAPFLR
jgi:hypothetical protein